MSGSTRIRPMELIFLIVAFALGVAAIYGASTLPPPFFEKLGPAAFPRAIGVIILALVAFKLVSVMLRPAAGRPGMEEPVGEEAPPAPNYRRPAAMFVLMCLYLAVLSLRLVDFRIVTGAFLFAGMWLASGRTKPSTLVLMALAAAVLSIGMDFFFRRFFFLDL